VLALAAWTAQSAEAQQFQPGAGLGSLDSGATGVYELGAVSFGRSQVDLRALVHNGQVLEVHGRHRDRWLAKRSGSVGGKAIAPIKLDELAAIAGGLNVDVRRSSSKVQQNFRRAAGLVALAGGEPVAGPAVPDAIRAWIASGLSAAISPAAASDCGAIGCRVFHRHGVSQFAGFRLSVDEGREAWGFEGYGIVAIWAIPYPDPPG
jgi:hypothetical protein